jgi:pimeloyl-ACP methyl ester carboxylesterase
MNTVDSKDGTSIAYDRVGEGPAVVLVDGALCSRAQGPMPELAALLAAGFTVYNYDRRGRGDSGDATEYEVDREIEDLAAVIEAAGGSAYVYGTSSGAALALRAAAAGVPITKLAVFEAPFVVDGSRKPVPREWVSELRGLADRPADAIRYFMTKGIGLPGFVVSLMKLMPAWRGMKAVAHTLWYDAEVVGRNAFGQPLDAAVGRDRGAGARLGWWEESGLDADFGAGRRGRRTGCFVSGDPGAEPHAQGRRDRAGADRILRRMRCGSRRR